MMSVEAPAGKFPRMAPEVFIGGRRGLSIADIWGFPLPSFFNNIREAELEKTPKSRDQL